MLILNAGGLEDELWRYISKIASSRLVMVAFQIPADFVECQPLETR
jgi:hypothetical protein